MKKPKELRNLIHLRDGYKDHLKNPKKYVLNPRDEEERRTLLYNMNKLDGAIKLLEEEYFESLS